MLSQYTCYICKNCGKFHIENFNIQKKPRNFRKDGTVFSYYSVKNYCSSKCANPFSHKKVVSKINKKWNDPNFREYFSKVQSEKWKNQDTLNKMRFSLKKNWELNHDNICESRKSMYTEEWRKHNSEAQLKIQSTPEQRLKNRVGVLNWLDNKGGRYILSEKRKDLWKSPDFRLKIKNSKKLRLSRVLNIPICEITDNVLNDNTGFGLMWNNGYKHSKETILKSFKTKKDNINNIISLNISNINTSYLDSIKSKLENRELRLPVGHSMDEFYFYEFLIKKCNFNVNDIEWCYTDSRYPYECDFYIKSLDLFIELNFFWTHGGHLLDLDSEDDKKILNIWKEKSEKSGFYKVAISTWISDLEKFNIAKSNNLNYLTFYNWSQINNYFLN